MAQANQAMAIKRFSDQHNLGYGLRDSYDFSQLIRYNGMEQLLNPELQAELVKAFGLDRVDELKHQKE